MPLTLLTFNIFYTIHAFSNLLDTALRIFLPILLAPLFSFCYMGTARNSISKRLPLQLHTYPNREIGLTMMYFGVVKSISLLG